MTNIVVQPIHLLISDAILHRSIMFDFCLKTFLNDGLLLEISNNHLYSTSEILKEIYRLLNKFNLLEYFKIKNYYTIMSKKSNCIIISLKKEYNNFSDISKLRALIRLQCKL